MCPLWASSFTLQTHLYNHCAHTQGPGMDEMKFLCLMPHHQGTNSSYPPFSTCLRTRLTLTELASLQLLSVVRGSVSTFHTPIWKWIFLRIHYKLYIALDLDLSPRIENLSLGVKEHIITNMTELPTHSFRVPALWNVAHSPSVISNISSSALKSYSVSTQKSRKK